MNKLTFILVAGGSGVGKDTFCDTVVKFSQDKENIAIFSYNHEDLAIDCMNECGWDGKKTIEMKELLKKLTQLSEKSGKLFEYLKTHITQDLSSLSVIPENVYLLLQVKDPTKVMSTLGYITPSIVEQFSMDLQPMKSILIKRRKIIDRDMQVVEHNNAFDYKFELSEGVNYTEAAAKAFVDILLEDE